MNRQCQSQGIKGQEMRQARTGTKPRRQKTINLKQTRQVQSSDQHYQQSGGAHGIPKKCFVGSGGGGFDLAEHLVTFPIWCCTFVLIFTLTCKELYENKREHYSIKLVNRL